MFDGHRWSREMKYAILFGAFCVALSPGSAFAKCMSLRLDIAGSVAGNPQGLVVRASTVNRLNEEQAVSAELSGGEFSLKLLFYPYSGRSFLGADKCSATPKEVRVVVMKAEKVLETRVLSWKEFSEESEGHYIARPRVTFLVSPTMRPN